MAKTLFQNLSTHIAKVAGKNRPLSLENLRLDLPSNGKLRAHVIPVNPTHTNNFGPQDALAKDWQPDGVYYQGSVAVSGADLLAILAIAGQDVAINDPNLLRHFSLEADLRWANNRLDLRNLSGKIDQISFRGGMIYTPDLPSSEPKPNGHTPTLGIALALNQFSPFSYGFGILPQPHADILSTHSTDQITSSLWHFAKSWLADLTVNSRMKIGQLDLGKIIARDVEITSSWQHHSLFIQKLHIDNFEGGLLQGGEVEVSGTVTDFPANFSRLPKIALSGQFRYPDNSTGVKAKKPVFSQQNYSLTLNANRAQLRDMTKWVGSGLKVRLDKTPLGKTCRTFPAEKSRNP